MRLTDSARKKTKTSNLKTACQYVNDDFPIRQVKDELENFLKKTDVSEKDFKKAMGRENAQKISNWLDNKTRISRESAIEIILTLNTISGRNNSAILDAEYFLTHSCWVDGFYERDYKDVIYVFCLKNFLTFEKAKELIKKYIYLDVNNSDAEEIENSQDNLTVYLEKQSRDLKTEGDLDNFFTKYRDYFGNFTRKAYKFFKEYYDLTIADIERIKPELNERKKYSRELANLEEICDEFPNKKNYEVLNLIQRVISEDDPESKRLSEILKKEKRVPRKYLILFFLTSEGDGESYENSIENLNSVLDQCGMPLLDSRNPFDWLVMNAFYISEKSNNSAIDRIKVMYKEIFGSNSKKWE